MGFRSTFVTDWYGGQFPHWFVAKWETRVNFGKGGSLPLSSKYEAKAEHFDELLPDLQRVLPECGWERLTLVWLHECTGVTRVDIYADSIRYTEPIGWEEVPEITHNYCYGPCKQRP